VTKRILLLLAAAVPIVWLSSCATAGRTTVTRLDAESTKHFEAARYQESIDIYREARKDYPGDKAIAVEYSKALSRLCGAGDASMRSGDFAAAERIYLLLQLNVPDGAALQPPPSFTRATLDARIRSSRIALAAARADKSIRAGEFPKAVAGYRELLKAFPREPAAAVKAVAGMESIRAAGDAALADNDFARAGTAYYALRKSFPVFPGAEKKLSFDRNALDAGLAACRTALTRQGLDLYRKGDLKAAIAVWKSLLLFDPDNAQIRKSVESASAQINRIES
jgi:tetratricopeptide (TPR) repeat protein